MHTAVVTVRWREPARAASARARPPPASGPSHEAVRLAAPRTRARSRPTPSTHRTIPSLRPAPPGTRPRGGAWMSRIAWITLNRAMRTLDTTMVTIEIASPIANPVITVDASKVKVRCSAFTSRPDLRIWSARHAMSHPKAIPSDGAERAGDHRVEPALRREPADEQSTAASPPPAACRAPSVVRRRASRTR